MKLRFFLTTLYTLIAISVLNSLNAKSTNFNYNAKNISNYFSALISFDNYDYLKSEKFFKKVKDSEKNNSSHSSRHIKSLISLQKYSAAERYSRSLEIKKISNFESNLILGLYEFKIGNSKKAKIYFNKLDRSFEHRMVSNTLKVSLNTWASIDKLNKKQGMSSINKIPERLKNFKVIQKTLAHCFFNTSEASKLFNKVAGDKQTNFSRYYFFYANYLSNKGDKRGAKKIINLASKQHPNNLLINQLKDTLNNNKKNNNKFICQNKNHILAEIFYVIANALSTQGEYELSNFYINLSKYLNPNFSSYDSMLAENFFILGKYKKAKNIYEKLANTGLVYEWYANKQIAFIYHNQNKKEEAINLLSESYKNIVPTNYQTFDFANFLKNRGKLEKSVELYSEILDKINENHELFPKVLDRRGTVYERLGNWKLAEDDLTRSLEVSPEQPYVMNYLAYSWIEKGMNLSKALEMLKVANELKKDDGYITDSLGWALYKLDRFAEAKKYLRTAIILMPSDPIVNDHFGDCLWKNNQKIQARYYWNYVLKLETTEEELKKTIKNKLIFGLEKI